MGGVPAQLVPDNPKVGVDRANWYEPGLNRTYVFDLATHYGTAILPTRTRKPRDKAKAEVAVLVVERWILARLRNRRFFLPAELNRAIAELVADLNARPMRRLGVSRRDLFVELDRPALKELPASPTNMPNGGRRPHPEQGYRACIGILRLARRYGAARLEAACDRGLDIGARSYGSIQSILKHGLDRQAPPRPAAGQLLPRPPQYPRPPLLPSTG